MHVHTVEISFTRQRRPADYEQITPVVSLKATLDEGEDHAAAARMLMTDACTTVYAGLGSEVPKAILGKLGAAGSVVHAPATAETPTTQDAPSAEAPADPPKRRRRTKKEMEAARAAEANTGSDLPDDTAPAATAPADTGSDLPDDTAPNGDNAAAAPSGDSDLPDDTAPAAQAPADTGSDLPDDTAPEEPAGDELDESISNDELHRFVTGRVSTQAIQVANVKAIMASFKASRTSDIPQEERQNFMDQIEAACTKKD